MRGLMHNRRGVTLIEVMIAIAILSMAGSAFLAILIHSLRGWSSGTSKDAASSQVTIALQKLENEIRDGRIASTSEDAKTLTVTFPRKNTDPGSDETVYDLSLNDPTPRSYYISDGNLVRDVGGTITIVTRGISEAQFGASGGSVTVTLTSSDQVGMSTSTQQANGRIYLRNYRS